MSAETVKVIIRCRPLNKREKDLACETVVNIVPSRRQCGITNPNDTSKKPQPKTFFFDGAYDTDSTTEQMYADIVYPLVDNVCEGYNGTVFAYGQTGCGKSFTMQGISSPDTQRGVIPRAFDHIFETISVSEKTKYLVHASYLEIYNEEIRDLLAKDTKAKLDLKEHPEKGVYVSNLSMHKVSNVKECQTVMERGWKNRSTGATLMNVDSSRSHSIFTIYLEMMEEDEKNKKNDKQHIRAGKLNLVDLAGSERQSKTGSTGDRLKEATKINLSLSALGNVISALVDGKSKHVPYRDSKLTRLLQDSLGGNTKTLMIACLSPADNNYDETLSTLRYANRAKNIQNKPKINEDPKDALLRQYQEEINKLKLMLAGKLTPEVLAAMNNIGKPPKSSSNQSSPKKAATLTEDEKQELIKKERQKIIDEYESKLAEKEKQYYNEAADKERLQKEIEKMKKIYNRKIDNVKVENIDQYITSNEDLDGPVPLGDFEKNINASYSANRDVVIYDAENNQPIKLGDQLIDNKMLQNSDVKNDLMAKLENLKSGMIGGEQLENKDIRQKVSRKKRHAEEMRRELMALKEKMDDDGGMLELYVDIQDNLGSKMKEIDKLKNKNTRLQQEILDIKEEHQRDNDDYLEGIRRLKKENTLLEAILDKVQPLIRKNCNYSNIDHIKQISRYDENDDKWIIPPVKLEHNSLPNSGDGVRDEDDRNYFNKLNKQSDPSQTYFNRNNRYATNSNPNFHNSSSPMNSNSQFNDNFHDTIMDKSDHVGDQPYSMNNSNLLPGRRLESLQSTRTQKSARKKRDRYLNNNNINDF